LDVARDALERLLRDDGASGNSWTAYINALSDHCVALGTRAQSLPRDAQDRFLAALLIMIAKTGMQDETASRQTFDLAQRLGLHVIPVHFYSPVPDLRSLPDSLWGSPNQHGWDLEEAHQLELLQKLSSWNPELTSIPEEAEPGAPQQYYWANPSFNREDAATFYALIRELRPRRILEVGGGYSTMIAAQAARANGDTRVDCIEPFPDDVLLGGYPGLSRLIQQPVQDVPIDEFLALDENDILFVDSTHVSKIGSDVNHLILGVLPRLRPGVVVHFHDVFLPWEYPRRWILEQRLFWNEQYLLSAFMMFNRDYRTLLANHYLGRKYPDLLRARFPVLTVPGQGVSFWIQRRRAD